MRIIDWSADVCSSYLKSFGVGIAHYCRTGPLIPNSRRKSVTHRGHIDIPQTDTERRPRLVCFRRSDRVGAIIRRIISARPVVARYSNAPERRAGLCTVCGLVPINDARPNIGPELIIMLGRAADEGSGQAIAGIVRLCDGVFETAHTDDLQQRTEEFDIGTFRHISHVNDRGREKRAAFYGAGHMLDRLAPIDRKSTRLNSSH